ncbi:trehalose-phosphatase [Lichenicoccus sp.]|uniref:trehalose-phosphatase n=1 Tax=Lichenicoccus sp. TaxID=2781899 RepID=UPI003D13F006
MSWIVPNADEAAFLLDFDGTLVDIAAAPELVEVAPGLVDTLLALRARVGDALALVSGRPIAELDHFLPDVAYAVAGEHGTALRHAPGAAVEHADLPAVPSAWARRAEQLAQAYPGVRIETKAAGLVLHYRAAPDAGETLRQEAEAMVAEAGKGFHVQASKLAWEIRPKGIDKGSAVRLLMARPPFVGRKPVFVGDDVTDEDGIRAAVALGGVGYRIPADFEQPAAVRAWLGQLARGEAGAWAA